MELFINWLKDIEGMSEITATFIVGELINVLVNYALIDINRIEQKINVHPLLQSVIRNPSYDTPPLDHLKTIINVVYNRLLIFKENPELKSFYVDIASHSFTLIQYAQDFKIELEKLEFLQFVAENIIFDLNHRKLSKLLKRILSEIDVNDHSSQGDNNINIELCCILLTAILEYKPVSDYRISNAELCVITSNILLQMNKNKNAIKFLTEACKIYKDIYNIPKKEHANALLMLARAQYNFNKEQILQKTEGQNENINNEELLKQYFQESVNLYDKLFENDTTIDIDNFTNLYYLNLFAKECNDTLHSNKYSLLLNTYANNCSLKDSFDNALFLLEKNCFMVIYNLFIEINNL